MKRFVKALMCLTVMLSVLPGSATISYADTVDPEYQGKDGWWNIVYFAPLSNGIDYTPVFDVEYYYEQNPDLQQKIGKNDELLFRHFLDSGMSQGRKSSRYFDINIYRENNPDLILAFGDDLKQYYEHYAVCGWKEGRLAFKADSEYQPDILVYYDRIKKAVEEAVLEEIDFVQNAKREHFDSYQIGWGSAHIGFYYDNYEHYHQVWLYAQKAAAFVCKEYPEAPWRPGFNVSNISWSKNSWQGPRNGWDNSKYVGDEFLSSGYIWLDGDLD